MPMAKCIQNPSEEAVLLRPRFHFSPSANWMNDPNGLCQVDGVYHLYYQYNPRGPLWGDIHWGHATSRDLLHWEERPVALYPARERGELHCFSGSCCKDAAGKPHFFYTSIGWKENGRASADGAEQWFAEAEDASLDHLVQREDVLTDRIHGGMKVRDWRDPYVLSWQGQYLMVLGGCVEGRGSVLLYTSPDMRSWTYHSVLWQLEKADGIPCECPNLFPLGDQVVLVYSPCAPAEVIVGTLDEHLRFHAERAEVLDPGGHSGFYAPQVFRDERGQTVMMGWMPETDGDEAARQRGGSGQMSLPRLLSLKEGRVLAEPLPAVWDALRETAGPVGRHFAARLDFCRTALPLSLTILASGDGQEKTVLTLTAEGRLTLDLSRSSLSADPAKAPIARDVQLAEENALFLAVDGTSVECMVNGQWLSGRAYPTRADASGLAVAASGTIRVTVREANE